MVSRGNTWMFDPRHVQSRPISQSTKSGQDSNTLLDFDWPTLPRIDLFSDAVKRRDISRGLAYIHHNENNTHKDSKATTSVDQTVGTHDAANVRRAYGKLSEVPRINAESEKWRQLYIHSAPSSQRLSARSSSLRRTPSARALITRTDNVMKKMAESIVESTMGSSKSFGLNADHEIGEEKVSAAIKVKENSIEVDRNRVADTIRRRVNNICPSFKELDNPKQCKTYTEFKTAKDLKSVIPTEMKSEYLTHVKNQEIWNWLHFGEELSDFEYFLSVCG